MSDIEAVLVLAPGGTGDAALCSTAATVGARGVLDIGTGDRAARAECTRLVRLDQSPLALRVDDRFAGSVHDWLDSLDANTAVALRQRVDLVVLGPGAPWSVAALPPGWRAVVEVDSPATAWAALAARPAGLIACGSEAGGTQLTSFVLVQKLLADGVDVPVWVRGGIGAHTAAAVVAGGAHGVVFTPADEPLRAVSRSLAAVVHAAEDARTRPFALGPDSPMAQVFGTELPVAQGPMTRVSDEPRFAGAVADAGGLPFLALAMAHGQQTRRMLERTRDELGDRPWGVGVLGFVDPELRAAQLEVVHEIKPRLALVAGGNPAQAAELEAAGIATFLHVSSSSLLADFVAAGARRFVFEGSECGGHVGPRTSFELWQDQVDVLLAAVDASPQLAPDLQVLFAGGIHDERSAAMVSALADPLSSRGVAVGVLMGTAYLFTAEAVQFDAVLPLFQRSALDAHDTALLESSPGHVIRCLQSPFVDLFRTTRADLLGANPDKRAVWQALEDLNTGRLRVASKGLRRDDTGLVAVDETEQWVDGLYMAGQVTGLRGEVTTIRELHDSVTTGAAEFVRRRATAPAAPPAGPAPVDIAIVGMACVLPGAPDLDTYWANTLGNVDCITEVPVERWDPAVYFRDGGADPSAEPRTPSKWGGFLPPVPFDALRYGIPPSAMGSIEPVQLVSLEVAQRALDDAGYGAGGFDRERTSVIFGAEAGSDLNNANVMRMTLPAYLGELPDELAEQLPSLTEDSFAGSLSNVISGRIANRLDLGGANYSVDAACGSSLAALDAACKELVTGTSDFVLCGAADLHNAASDYLLFASVGALSARGRCAAFDAEADGIALGEGVACLALKRLADAERDGDRVYAVVKGIGSSSDGHSLGLTAPRPEGQQRALERAHQRAGITADRVGLLEAHGTGTVVGDRTELSTLERVFGAAGAEPGSCTLGSVKSQIGHTKCAAGLAGTIRAALAVHHGVRPPTRHMQRPNDAWTPDSPFTFTPAALPWGQRADERIAGISAFGFGGTNFHAVLQGHQASDVHRSGHAQWPAELVVVRGADAAAAARSVDRLRRLVADNDARSRPWRLRDLARTAAGWADRAADAGEPVQFAVVAADLDELDQLLAAAVAGEARTGVFLRDGSAEPGDAGDAGDAGDLAVLFPGQGSQRTGMLAELMIAFPQLQDLGRAATDVAAAMYPARFGPSTEDEQRARLQDTTMAQPALGIAGLAVHAVLTAAGIVPDMLAGHSYGELVALCAAGAFSPDDLVELSIRRARAITGAVGEDPGTMAAVAAGIEDVRRVLGDADLAADVTIANHNAPRQVVVSGPTGSMDAALDAMRSAGLAATRLPVACAFHSAVVADGAPVFGEALAGVDIRTPELPVWRNRTATPYPAGADGIRTELTEQLASSVRFVDEIEAMYAAGARTFVEAGPGRTLSRLVADVLGDRPHTTITCDGGLPGLLTALARLAVDGRDVRVGPLFADRDARDVTDLVAPKPAGWTVDGRYVRTIAGAVVPGGLTPPRPLTEVLMSTRAAAESSEVPALPAGEALLTEFLRSSREIVAAQRDVLLGYFGTAGGAPAAPLPVSAPSLPSVAAAPVTAPAAPAVAPAETPAATVEPVEQDVLAVVIDVIAQRTGYPTEMIESDLDLEAELSVDSIKRTEIGAQVCRRLDIGAADPRFDAVVKQRTAQGMAEALGGSPAAAAPEAAAPAADPAPPATDAVAVRELAPERYRSRLVPAPAGLVDDPDVLSGTRFVVHGGAPELAAELAGRLTEAGVDVECIAATADLPDRRPDGVISLAVLDDDAGPFLPGGYDLLQQALAAPVRWLFVVTSSADEHPRREAAGLRGALRSLAVEHPQVRCRLLELPAAGTPDLAAASIVSELLVANPDPVVVRTATTREAFVVLPAPTGEDAETADLDLGPDAVVLVIGGARGIGARTALALATRNRCRVEIAGRTAYDDTPEPAQLAAALDLPALRSALAAGDGPAAPAEIDARAREILARREVATTLRELQAAGARAEYRTVDVRDAGSVAQLVKQVQTEAGRLDAVVFAAGVIEDHLFLDKTLESLARVHATKVDGAVALLDALSDLPTPPAVVVFFGSIAAAVGNRGQTDYAAANDALETIGHDWSARTGGRVLTVHWGPWSPSGEHAGMVSPELARRYAQRGVGLIEPAAGVHALLAELAHGLPGSDAIVLAAPGSLEPPAAP